MSPALPHGVSDHTPSHDPGYAVPSPALQPARDDPVPPAAEGGGGLSPQTETSDPRVAPQAGGKGPGQETEAGDLGLAPLIVGAGHGQGVEGGALCFAAVHSTDGTGGSGNPATLQSSFSVNSAAQGPGHDAVPARRLHG